MTREERHQLLMCIASAQTILARAGTELSEDELEFLSIDLERALKLVEDEQERGIRSLCQAMEEGK